MIDWFDTRIGRTIGSVASGRCFGQMGRRTLCAIIDQPRITLWERDRIDKAGHGEGRW